MDLNRRFQRFALIACVAAAIGAAGAADAVAQNGAQAGVAGAVRGQVKQVSAIVPGASVGRVVTSGDKLYLGDRISTNPRSGLQVMLLDGTTLTIGPNAALVIDEFVYNPSTSEGKVVASILKGTFRFVSGKIARRDPKAVKIKLPVATIGIRGTTVVGDTNGQAARVTLVGAGPGNTEGRGASRIIVSAGGVQVVIHRPGFGVVITRPGAPPTKPSRTPTKVLELWNQLLGRWGTLPGGTLRQGEQSGARTPLGQGASVIEQSGADVVVALDPAKDAGTFDLIQQVINGTISQTRPTPQLPPPSPTREPGGIDGNTNKISTGNEVRVPISD